MAKIKVKQGGCGIKYTDAHGHERHALKTPESGAFECDDTQAARLVRLGVAEYVNELSWQKKSENEEPAAQQDTEDKEPAEPSQEPEKVMGHLDPAQLGTMNNEQLKKLAGEIGADLKGCKKKADYIAAIVAVEVEIDPEAIVEDPDDDLPELNAADPE